jgi:Ferritin-like
MDNEVSRFVAEKPRRAQLNFLVQIYKPIETIDDLRAATQTAMQVELTTIPAYLTALYSIKDRTSDAYQTLRSVVMEEMFHVNQAANLLVGIGGIPVFTGEDVVPRYPAYLPSANKKRTPYVGLFRASPEVFQKVFMGIETPAHFKAPPQDEQYNTIAQFYAALQDGIKRCVQLYGEEAVFKQDRQARQRCDIYLGKFGGQAVEVINEATAYRAIEQIVRQGEGVVRSDGSLKADEAFGEYHYYGARTDGTYGPILGKPREPSHYVKFSRVANADDFPDTYPIISSPKLTDFTNMKAVKLAIAFNKAYSLMLRTLELSFHALPSVADPYFQLTLPLMHRELATIAAKLMSTLAHDNRPDDQGEIPGSPDVGPNAAPTFEWDEQSSLEDVIKALKDVEIKSKLPIDQATSFAAIGETQVDAQAKHALASLIEDFEELLRRARQAQLPI